MPSETNLYESYVQDCVRAADRVSDPQYRELLLKMAREWAQEAQRRGSHACLHPDDSTLLVEPRA